MSSDRPSRLTDGSYGVLYAADWFETALWETMYHRRYMARTHEPPGWTSQFRELGLRVKAPLHDLRGGDPRWTSALDRDDYRQAQILGKALREAASEGVVYPSQRDPAGQCVGLFYPDRAATVSQARHSECHWSGTQVDLYRNAGNGQVFRVG